MKKYLYLDDEREPSTDKPWDIVRTYDDAVNYVKKHGIPDYISFDHDLGEEKTGYDFAKWLVEQDLDGKRVFPSDFEYNVHSANPVGAKNIDNHLGAYRRYRNYLWG